MATMKLHATGLFLLIDGKAEERHTSGEVIVSGSSNHFVGDTSCPEWPELSIMIQGDESESRAVATLVSYEDIDALRRYCEMVLYLLDKNRLE